MKEIEWFTEQDLEIKFDEESLPDEDHGYGSDRWDYWCMPFEMSQSIATWLFIWKGKVYQSTSNEDCEIDGKPAFSRLAHCLGKF